MELTAQLRLIDSESAALLYQALDLSSVRFFVPRAVFVAGFSCGLLGALFERDGALRTGMIYSPLDD